MIWTLPLARSVPCSVCSSTCLQTILNAASNTGVGRFVFISSGGAVYGETLAPANEHTPPQPDAALAE